MLSLRLAKERWSAWPLIVLPLGVLEYVSGEHPDWALVAWVVPLLWLLFFHHTRPLVGYGVGLLGLTLVYSTQHTVNILEGTSFHVTNLVFAATYLLPFLLTRTLMQRVAPAGRWLLLPLGAVSVEYVLALGPNGTWGSVGYSQQNLYLRQLTACTGIYGLTFLLYATASLLFEALGYWRVGQRAGRPLRLAAGLLVVCFTLGWLRLQQQAPVRASVRVLGLTFQDARSWPWFQQLVGSPSLTLRHDRRQIRQKAVAAHRYYLTQTQHWVRRYHPRWVIWQEAALVVYWPDYAAFAARNARFAAAEKLYLGVTYFLVDERFPAQPGTNHLTIFSPQGQVLYDYAKNKPVDGMEPALAAQQPPTLFQIDRIRYTGAICADFDYPSIIRHAGMANIVFAPAADWPGIGELHARMAATRAVENGFALFRITSHGTSSLTTAYGETRNSQQHLSPTVQALLATVPVQPVWTPYHAWGDFFAWLCLGGFFLLAGSRHWLFSCHRSSLPAYKERRSSD
ncbi:hypothetical protein [Hymenobacter sp. GOD-10R]|uniref:hypothetical protein n=1 Tax=Hymenobacter sp. GOD-10R TaxID=3093922 RepID=UPI002D7872AE|nr:hypothetical protein [Hymenobacter sp. GOD-10R]WRQ31806.1 hypothetical protein SD425_28575 [Hymenobacter sp. GOD-10R]